MQKVIVGFVMPDKNRRRFQGIQAEFDAAQVVNLVFKSVERLTETRNS